MAIKAIVASRTESGTDGVPPRQHGKAAFRCPVDCTDALLPLPTFPRPGGEGVTLARF